MQIGRTHGVHAEPITFGLKLAIWYEECGRNLSAPAAPPRRTCGSARPRARWARSRHIGPEVEERICERLNLKPAPVASQVIQRDRHAAFVSALALATALCEKIALEVRHLQRTEVREAEEYFARGQKGSSAMPHKRNPVTCEQICGLARVVRANVQAAFEDVALWHERDISHSSVERVILPDSTILTDYLLEKTTQLVDRLLVYPERMRRNLEMTRGLVFSGQVLLDLAAAGMLREQAYRVVQAHAMRAWEEEGDFRAAIEADPEIAKVLDARTDRGGVLARSPVAQRAPDLRARVRQELSESCAAFAEFSAVESLNTMKGLALFLSLSAIAQGAEYRLKASPSTVVWGYYWSAAKPVLRIRSGDTVVIQTMITNNPARLMAAGVKPEDVQPELKAIYDEVKDKGPGGHILTGPIYVEGAEPGDALEVRIQKIQLSIPYAYNSFSPRSGVLGAGRFCEGRDEDHSARCAAHGGAVFEQHRDSPASVLRQPGGGASRSGGPNQQRAAGDPCRQPR